MKRLNCHRMVKQSLLLPSAAAYAALLLTLALAEDDCLWLAQNEHPASPLDYYDQLYRHSRTTPASLPALSISDWELGHYLTEPAAGWPQLPPETFWGQELIMPIKVYKGVVYVIWPHNDTAYRRDFWKHTREIALEQLLTAVWLYKDFPDVEFLLNTLDTPVASTGSGLQMPFLEYSAFNNTSPFGYRLPINPQHIVASNYQAKWCSGHGRGWVIPHQDAWEQLSLSPGQLQYYSYCTWSRYGTGGSQPEDVIITEDVDIPARKLIITSESQMSHDLDVPRRNSLANVSQQRKKVKRTPPLELFLQMKKQVNWTTSHRHTVFWRGSATGNQGGWASQVTHQYFCYKETLTQPTFLAGSLLNKRVSAALLSRHEPKMDVGLTKLYHQYTRGWQNTTEDYSLAAQIEQLTLGSAVPFEAWSQFQLTLSIDGNGPPYRLPRQLMSMVPVMKVDSNQREWFAESLKPGVHYEAVEYDLGDLTMRADALLTEAARDSSRLQAMAIAARDLAVSRSHLVAQLDAFMWSVAQLKKALQYQVQDPASPGNWSWGQESGWVPLQLPKDGTWISPGMRRFAKDIAQALPQNFV